MRQARSRVHASQLPLVLLKIRGVSRDSSPPISPITRIEFVSSVQSAAVSSELPPHFHHGIFVALSAFQSFLKNVPRLDPCLCLVVHLFRIRGKDDSLARPENAGIHDVVKPFGKFPFVVMRVSLMVHVNVCLCAF